jgi:hypothetical protein
MAKMRPSAADMTYRPCDQLCTGRWSACMLVALHQWVESQDCESPSSCPLPGLSANCRSILGRVIEVNGYCILFFYLKNYNGSSLRKFKTIILLRTILYY